MAIRPNKYSDPNIGAAFEGLASLFAPTSAQDLQGYANMDKLRAEAALKTQQQGLVDLYVNGGNERAGIGGGLFTPNQSMEAVRIGDATDRYGFDRSYASSTENNVRDNTRALQSEVLKGVLNPLAQGETRQVLDEDILSALGLDGTPTIPGFAGAPKPLSETEVKGQLLQQQAVEDPAFTNWILGGSKDPIKVRNESGQNVMIQPHLAAGMGVYETARDANVSNYITPEGVKGIAIIDPYGRMSDAATGAAVPAGSSMFGLNAKGTADEVGLGQTPQNKLQMELVDNEATQMIGQRLRTLVASNSASQGAVGGLRGIIQDAVQTGGEIGAYFGGDAQRIMADVTNGLADASMMEPGGAFDPTLPQIDTLLNMFAYNYAKSVTGERLSNEAVKQWRESLGMGNALGNQANTLARLDEALLQLKQRNNLARSTLGEGNVPARQGQMFDQGAAPPPAEPSPSVAPETASGPPTEAAIQYLRDNPTEENARLFDKFYKLPGAAAIYLGK